MEPEIIQIDLDNVIKQRLPKVYRFTPRFMIKWLEKLICQEPMNHLLRTNHPKQGVDFAEGVLNYLDIRLTVVNEDNLPHNSDDWNVLFVSNHPLGGLDGMALITLIGRRAHGGKMKFIVNDLLMNIPPLRTVFLPVNTLSGHQSKRAAIEIDNTLAGSEPVAIFPAGLCSRLVDGHIQDLEWNKMFINKAIAYKRDIIPVHFDGKNSGFFYKFAKLRKMFRIPVNLEMSLLPKEVFRNRGRRFTITIGKRIPWQELEGGKKAAESAQTIRQLVYALPKD